MTPRSINLLAIALLLEFIIHKGYSPAPSVSEKFFIFLSFEDFEALDITILKDSKVGKMRDETKELILRATDITKRIVHIGFIPFIIYLGFTRSTPKPSLIRMISPLA
ncbi:hypothetical protein K7432_016774 [Basidiobolus ranarum]|uniref:Translocase of outer membrane 7 kDa subunit homolog n=3 Tax=Basidiobolus TaxID=4859 RepID=A0ABR2WE89_9FUNG